MVFISTILKTPPPPTSECMDTRECMHDVHSSSSIKCEVETTSTLQTHQKWAWKILLLLKWLYPEWDVINDHLSPTITTLRHVLRDSKPVYQKNKSNVVKTLLIRNGCMMPDASFIKMLEVIYTTIEFGTGAATSPQFWAFQSQNERIGDAIRSMTTSSVDSC